MTDNLKPCPNPWCNAIPVFEHDYERSRGTRYVCPECDLCGPFGATLSEAADLWNARPEMAVKVKPLDFPERRYGYWGHMHGYQIAHTNAAMFRVRLNGRVICKNISGFDRAVK